MTAPVRTFLSLVRTKAPPLPGLTCWNSTTEKRPSGRSRLIPFFRSLVLTLIGLVPGSYDDQVLRGVGETTASFGGDDDGVFDPHAATPGEVHARLDGDDVAGFERSS